MLALFLRGLWIFAVQNPPVGETPWFDARVKDLLAGIGYQVEGNSTAFFPVGYPLFLTAIYWVFGQSYLVAKIANVLLGGVLCLLTYFLGRQVYDARVGIVAGALMAIYPNQIFYTSIPMSEVLYSVFLLGFLTLFCGNYANRSLTYRLFTGVTLGLACLIRPVTLIIPPLVLMYMVMRKMNLKQLFTQFSILMIGFLIVIGPWTMRNRILMNDFILVSTNGGLNFWMSITAGGYVQAPRRFTGNWEYPVTPEQEVRAEKIAYREAWEYLKQHPLNPLLRFPKKLLRFFYADIDGLLINSGLPKVDSVHDLPRVFKQLPLTLPLAGKGMLFFTAEIFYLLLFTTALAGVYLALQKSNEKTSFLILILGVYTLFHTLIYFPVGRFRLPIMPVFAVFSAAFLCYRIRNHPRNSS
jgi:4-amino-4-deoxy-L-arabinose transferase-like glycosyltransferase